MGRPLDAKNVNLLWPFTVDSSGKLLLTEKFKGYRGVGFLGLEEFDDFYKKFGRREIIKNANK